MILSVQKFKIFHQMNYGNDKLLERVIKETEFVDFKKLAGKCIYNGILNEINSETGLSEELSDIMEMGVYECISYLSYANWLLQSNVVNTYSGAVQKQTDYSEPVSSGQIKNLNTYNREIALEYWKTVEPLLNEYFGTGECGCGAEGNTQDHFTDIDSVNTLKNCRHKIKVSEL